MHDHFADSVVSGEELLREIEAEVACGSPARRGSSPGTSQRSRARDPARSRRQKVHACRRWHETRRRARLPSRRCELAGGRRSVPPGRRAERAGRRRRDRALRAEYGALDFIVNNAGILGEGRLHETTNELWDDLVATHLTGAFWGCKHAVAAMRESGRGGSIVNIGSILSFTGDGYLAAYTAMKSGVLGLTKAIAIDYALDGIRCNCVCPGDMETPMIEQYFDGTADAAEARRGDGAGLPGQADRPPARGRDSRRSTCSPTSPRSSTARRSSSTAG